MTSYAVYLKDNRAPVLVRDGFSVWALLFGPLWLLVHAAWIPAALLLALDIELRLALHPPVAGIVGLGVAWLVGLHAQDLRGWSLARRGWSLAHIVTGRGRTDAYARLLTSEPAVWAAAAAR
jgi:hypothetical protein